MGAITQVKLHTVSSGARRKDGEARGDVHIAQARFQPAYTICTDRFDPPRVLNRSRKHSVEIGPCHRMTDERRSDVRPGVEDDANGPECMQPRSLPSPLNGAFTNH